MRRIRVVFLLLGVLLLAPLSVLLVRAWQGIERERDARHELVASRVFDESERGLDEFLRGEQQRLAEGIERVDGTPAGGFVIGYFEIDRNGRLSTSGSRDRAALETELRDVLPQLTSSVSSFSDQLAKKDSGEKEKRRKLANVREEQAPGSTRLLQKVGPLKGVEQLRDDKLLEAKQEAADESADSDLSSYNSVVERLNLGSRSQVEKAEPSKQAASAAVPPASAPAPQTELAADNAAPEPERDFEALPAATLDRAQPADTFGGAGASVVREEAEPRRGSLQGMLSRDQRLAGLLSRDQRLILHRTVLRAGSAYEQGVIVDLRSLSGWLESSVLGASGLRPYLELDFSLEGLPISQLRSDRFVYEHRFQEPFDTLTAQLSVAPLPEESSAAYLYALGALLALASTAGVWAVYRRVAAAVHFSERRSNFAAAVSHELKTPLTSIRMYAEMLRDGMAPDEATRRSYLDTITSESERLTRLINNVLEFSRLERRTQDPVLVSETPLPALRAALRTLEPHARALGFALREASAEPIPPALFDRDALQQILFNLIDNALKYARRAERKEIEVGCAPCAGGVAVRVRDFGPGVAREHEAHLFEPFYRGGDELTRQTQGTGIGLALVRELAQRMGAAVSAQNCPDGGFAVELRLRSA